MRAKITNRFLVVSVAVSVCLSFGVMTAQCKTYYVSQSTGNDSWTGLAESLGGGTGPWKTLAKASQQTYAPGDTLLLKRGDTWNEELHPTGEGTAASPISIGAYGTGSKPLIDRQDSTGNNIDKICIHLKNIAGYKIQGLEFARCGRGVFADLDKGVHGKNYLWIEDCTFRDSLYYKCTGWYTADIPSDGGTGPDYVFDVGVWIQTRETNDVICLSDVTITNCHFQRVACAINLWSGNEWDKNAENRHQFQNVVIDHCTAEDGKNWQFVLHSTHGGRISNSWVHRVAYYDERVPNGVAGSMLYRCEDILLENCEFGYISIGKDSVDGQTMDYEGNCTRIVARNCLFHDTEGPGFLMCWKASANANTPNRDGVFDNCVFNCKETRWRVNYKAPYTIFSDSSQNTATLGNCRFYLSEGEHLTNQSAGLTFTNCVFKRLNKACSTANLAVTATASASSAEPGYEALRARDGNSVTAWRAAAPTDQWLQLDFGRPTTVNEFRIKEAPSSSISRYVIEYWDDKASKWVGCFNGATIGVDFIAPIVSRTTQKARLMIIRTTKDNPAIISFEAYNDMTGEISNVPIGGVPPARVGK